MLWQQDDIQPGEIELFEILMDRFIAEAEAVNMLAPVEFGQAVQVLYRRATEQPAKSVDDAFFALSNTANDGLIDMLDQIAGHQTPVFDGQLLGEIQDFEFTVIENAIDIELQTKQVTVDNSVDGVGSVEALSHDGGLSNELEIMDLDLKADGVETNSESPSEIEFTESSDSFKVEELIVEESSQAPIIDEANIFAAMSDMVNAVNESRDSTEAIDASLEPEPEPEQTVESEIEAVSQKELAPDLVLEQADEPALELESEPLPISP